VNPEYLQSVAIGGACMKSLEHLFGSIDGRDVKLLSKQRTASGYVHGKATALKLLHRGKS